MAGTRPSYSVAALAGWYFAQGWSVVPAHAPVNDGCTCNRPQCSTPGKHPRGEWKKYQQQRATKEEVQDWLDSYDPLNIGMITGRISGIVVIDVDMPDPDIVAENLGLPLPTLTAITGGGGRHYFYTCDKRVKSLVGWDDGVDVRAEGGFIVLPPSRHSSGAAYKWSVKTKPLPFPSELLTGRLVQNDETRHSENGWHLKLLDGVEQGERSYSAARLAGRYARMGLSKRECAMLLSVWNEMNTPPMHWEELKTTIRSIYKSHEQEDKDIASWASKQKEAK